MTDWQDFERAHLWHPYASVTDPPPVWPVTGAEGVRLQLADGRTLIDGMASWWSVIHGYNHPVLNQALCEQGRRFAHVMFGGLTHEPAVRLAEQLVGITPEGLNRVFFADSGSVSVEVALKMAVQYWQGRGQPQRQRFLSVRRGYHGDTLGAMSVSDPEGGMHDLFRGVLPRQLFVEAPACRSDADWNSAHIEPMAHALETQGREIAAVILEPIVQGAGGMRFYCPEYLRQVRALCDAHEVLLICDEIATGFGRTGRLFACEHAGITPDILCLGKALTGGYMTLAATLTGDRVAEGICAASPGVFMHGPTFMANPLACAVATASIDLLLGSDWQGRVARLEAGLKSGLAPCAGLPQVREVRVLGAIGVVELEHPVDMERMPGQFVERGVWVRPFRNLVYVMPPYVMDDGDLVTLTDAIVTVVSASAETPT